MILLQSYFVVSGFPIVVFWLLFILHFILYKSKIKVLINLKSTFQTNDSVYPKFS